MPLSFNTLPPIAAGGSSGRSSLAGNYANTGRLASGLSRHNENIAKGIQERRKQIKEEEKELNLLRSQARSYLQLGEKYIDREFSDEDKETNPEYRKANAFWESLRDSMNRRSLPEMRDAVGRMGALFNTHNWLREQKALDRQATEERLQNKLLQQQLDHAEQAQQLAQLSQQQALLNNDARSRLFGLSLQDWLGYLPPGQFPLPSESSPAERNAWWNSVNLPGWSENASRGVGLPFPPDLKKIEDSLSYQLLADLRDRRIAANKSEIAAAAKEESARIDRRNRTVMGYRNAMGNPLPALATVEHRDQAATLIKDTTTMLDAIATMMAVERWYHERSRTLGGKNITKEDARAPLGILNQARKEMITPVRSMLEDKGNLGQSERPVFEQITEGGALIDDLDVFFKKVATRSALLNAWINTEKRLIRAMATLNFENEEDRPFDVNEYVPKVTKRGIKKSMPDGSRRLMRLEDGPWRGEEELAEILTPEDRRWREDNREILKSRVDETIENWLKINELQSIEELNQIGNAGLRDQLVKFLENNYRSGYAGEYVGDTYIPYLTQTAPDDYSALPEEQPPARMPTETGSVPMEIEEPAEELPDARSLIVDPPTDQPPPRNFDTSDFDMSGFSGVDPAAAVEEEVPVDAPIEERIAGLQQRIAAGEFDTLRNGGLSDNQKLLLERYQRAAEEGRVEEAFKYLQGIQAIYQNKIETPIADEYRFTEPESETKSETFPSVPFDVPLTDQPPQASSGGAGIPNLAGAISRIPRTAAPAPLNLMAPIPPLARDVPLMPRPLINRPNPLVPISGGGEAGTQGQPQLRDFESFLREWEQKQRSRNQSGGMPPLLAGQSAASEEDNPYANVGWAPKWAGYLTGARDREAVEGMSKWLPFLGADWRPTYSALKPTREDVRLAFEHAKATGDPNYQPKYGILPRGRRSRGGQIISGGKRSRDEKKMLDNRLRLMLDHPRPIHADEAEEYRALLAKRKNKEEMTPGEKAQLKIYNWRSLNIPSNRLTGMEALQSAGVALELVPGVGLAGRAVTAPAGWLGKGAGKVVGKGVGKVNPRAGRAVEKAGEKWGAKLRDTFKSAVPEPPLHAQARQVVADNPRLIQPRWLHQPAPPTGYGFGRTPGGSINLLIPGLRRIPDPDLRALNPLKNLQARRALAQAGIVHPAPTRIGRLVEASTDRLFRKNFGFISGNLSRNQMLFKQASEINPILRDLKKIGGDLDYSQKIGNQPLKVFKGMLGKEREKINNAVKALYDRLDGKTIPGRMKDESSFIFNKNSRDSLDEMDRWLEHTPNTALLSTHQFGSRWDPRVVQHKALRKFFRENKGLQKQIVDLRSKQKQEDKYLAELATKRAALDNIPEWKHMKDSRARWKNVIRWYVPGIVGVPTLGYIFRDSLREMFGGGDQ